MGKVDKLQTQPLLPFSSNQWWFMPAISSTTWGFWQNNSQSFATAGLTAGAATMQTMMNRTWLACASQADRPDLIIADNTLAQLYEDIWTNTAYRRVAPGERHIMLMLEALKPHIGDSFIDFGCGTGRPAKELQKRGYGVLGVDFAYNCLDADVDIPFLVADLTELPQLSAKFGYCTDVLEHIEPERVDEVLSGIARCVRVGVFFSIAIVDDNFGPVLVGKQLHLTVKDGEWWREKLREHWPQVDIIERNEAAAVYIACRRDKPPPPGFTQHRENLVNTVCNSSMEDILANVKANAPRDIKWLSTCKEHERHAVLVGGGPSLAASLGEISERAAHDQDIFALNGAAVYLVEQGITPDYVIIIDPRPDNVGFIRNPCARSYLLASQCHPSVFDAIEGRDVMMFHLMVPDLVETLRPMGNGRIITPIMGMLTSGLVAMSVVMCAGYRKLHLYGYDSSDAEGEAHAYAQEMNVAESKRIITWFDGRSYTSGYAMFKQAEQFESYAQMLADHGAIITVHGCGLLPDIAREMAKQQGEGNGLRSE
jgi:SAM-dependent methyltransferase